MRSRSCSPLGGGLVLPGRGLVSGGSLGGSSSGGLCENQQPGETHTRTLHRRWARRAPAHAHAHAPCPRRRGRAVATAARRPTWRARATPQHERHSPRPRAPLRPHPRAAAPPRDSLLPGIVASTRSRVEGRGVLFRGPLRAGGGGSATPSPMALALPESASASAPRTRPLDCLDDFSVFFPPRSCCSCACWPVPVGESGCACFSSKSDSHHDSFTFTTGVEMCAFAVLGARLTFLPPLSFATLFRPWFLLTGCFVACL